MKKIIIILVTVGVSLLVIAFIRNLLLPPGCRTNTGLIMGGCFGKQFIKTSEKTIPQDCLTVYFNDCNIPNIRIDNNCKDTLIIDGISYKEGEQYSIDLQVGNYRIEGSLANRPLRINGTVTPPLCE